jgi:hypothetical protein
MYGGPSVCIGGGGSSSDTSQQDAIQQQQIQEQADASAAQLAQQQQEFNEQSAQAAQTLANTQAQEAQQQAEADQTAALTTQFDTGREQEQATATGDIDSAFAAFTPAYYNSYTQAYEDHYQPQVQQQYDTAENQTTYGLARSGNLQSQTAANQYQSLNQQEGTALDDIDNQAVGATATLEGNVASAQQNLINEATSDATLGSPVVPNSADAISSQFNTTSSAINDLNNTAGDTVNTLQATPVYSSLGSLFGAAASGAAAAQTGANNYALASAYNTGSTVGASNPTSSSSGVVN